MSNPSPAKPWTSANAVGAEGMQEVAKELGADKQPVYGRVPSTAPPIGNGPNPAVEDEASRGVRKPWEKRPPYQSGNDYYSGGYNGGNYAKYASGAYSAGSGGGIPSSLVYGNYGGGCGGGYSGFGNYGGYGVYNGYGMNNCGAYNGYNNGYNGYNGPARTIGWYGAADKGFQWVNGFHSITAGFGRFAGLLDANSQAMHGMLTSIVRLVESAGFLYKEVGVLISSVTVFRLIRQLIRKLLGRRRDERLSRSSVAFDRVGSADVHEFMQHTSGRRRLLSVLFFASTVTFFGLPYLCDAILRAAKFKNTRSNNNNNFEEHFENSGNATRQQQQQQQRHDQKQSPPPRMPIMQVRALYDHHKSSEEEIDIRRGDIINVFDKPFELWWEGEVQGRLGAVGLFPTNLTQLI